MAILSSCLIYHTKERLIMSKRYYLTKKQFKKLDSTVKELFDLIFVSKSFANSYITDICEAECIIPLLKYIQRDIDDVIAMVNYLETKDPDLADIF